MDHQEIKYGVSIRCGSREHCTSEDGRQWYRKLGAKAWELYTPEQPPEDQQSSSPYLWLVRQSQPSGGPYHWLLAVASEEGGIGDLYQVKGDAIRMYYAHVKGIDVFVSQTYHDSFNLGRLDQSGQGLVGLCATNQVPPAAENAAMIKENCQGWTIRVIEDLESRGVIRRGTAAKFSSTMEPVRY
ncbi:hypothetical protein F4803DRAFT_551134 [Xylaria telfairii]|nr:hypothetical protein F4803DRAFT_551134 [Xylaria telfairii]